jgi:hypothetical protein
MPAIVQASQSATKCEAGFTTNRTMAGVGTNQTIYAHVNFSPGVSPTLPTDTFLLTFTQIRCDTWTDGRGAEHTCAYYAHTGSHSGSDTVTLSASNMVAFVGSYASSDVLGTGSSVDSMCFATGSVPTSNSSFTTCSITTTQTNDVYNYMVNTSVGASCNFYSRDRRNEWSDRADRCACKHRLQPISRQRQFFHQSAHSQRRTANGYAWIQLHQFRREFGNIRRSNRDLASWRVRQLGQAQTPAVHHKKSSANQTRNHSREFGGLSMRLATSQTPNNIRKKVGPAVWLLSVCVHRSPAEWTGNESAWIAAGNPITDAQLAEWPGESARTIAEWGLRLRKLGLLGWHVVPGKGRAFWVGPVSRVLEALCEQRPAVQSTIATPVVPAIWRVIQERSIALIGKVVVVC